MGMVLGLFKKKSMPVKENFAPKLPSVLDGMSERRMYKIMIWMEYNNLVTAIKFYKFAVLIAIGIFLNLSIGIPLMFSYLAYGLFFMILTFMVVYGIAIMINVRGERKHQARLFQLFGTKDINSLFQELTK